MKILITGSHGFVGQAVTNHLAPHHELLFFSRDLQKSPNLLDLPEVDAIIHLSGENISGYWTQKKKQRIKESRCDFTEKLTTALIEQNRVPKIFLSASAVGYYGDRGEEILDETAAKGEGFLSDVCACWEHASKPLAKHGARLVHMRFGMVLSKTGGALKKMLLPFKLGLGGRIGSGKQYMSSITLKDLTRAIEFVLMHKELSGPVNFCSPEPLTNLEFSERVAKSVNRTLGPPLPAFLAKLLFGQMGKELLLSSTRAYPKKFLDAGFHFNKKPI
ncbi:MAG: TIGR01777 family oxidoreductase [Candidatus Algichlamydia australiensis]|nr:TIGR01777 family oxidoreductase [Chlamydiales bacterium]